MDFDAAAVVDGSRDSNSAEVLTEGGEGLEAPCEPECPVLDWVNIPKGFYDMGFAEGEGFTTERPLHGVAVPALEMLKTEVTVYQYASCINAGVCAEPHKEEGYSNAWNWESMRIFHPANGVDWNQSRKFCDWIGGRLPSEAEWEYAARSGGLDVAYPWGDERATCDFAIIPLVGFHGISSEPGCGEGTTGTVCSKPDGDTEQGLCDMVGNVSEWVEDDWHDSYDGAPVDGSAWIDTPRNDLHPTRGGGFFFFDAHDFNTLGPRFNVRNRSYLPSDSLSELVNVGFRCARDASEKHI
jgi:formylglycine-generating enzyme required for sulfatase activity